MTSSPTKRPKRTARVKTTSIDVRPEVACLLTFRVTAGAGPDLVVVAASV